MALNKKQKDFLEAYLQNPTLGMTHYAQEQGISKYTVYQWRNLNTNGFKDEMDQALENRWNEMKERASDLMFELAEEKDFRAVKYILDYQGYGAPQKVELESKDGITINIVSDEN